jgi:Protein of unknown function (DUF2934)
MIRRERKMSKRHLQNLADQISSKGHASAPFHYEKMSSAAGGSRKPEDIQTKITDMDNAIQLRAYQIYLEKGGSALDNWLEAERSFFSQELVTKA